MNIKKLIREEIGDFEWAEDIGSSFTKQDVHGKIIDVKNDPDELLELIQFLNNKEKYIQLKTSKEITKKTETTFANILKNNVNKKVGGFQDVKEPPLKTKALTLNDYLK